MSLPTRRSSTVLSGAVYVEARPAMTLLHIRQIGSMDKWSVYAGDRPLYARAFSSIEEAEAALERAMAA